MKTFKSTLPQISLRYKPSTINKVKITCSRDAVSAFRQIFDPETLGLMETFNVLFTNRANNTIAWMQLSQGGVTGTVVDGRLIFKAAIECCASGILLCHNHPSGNLNPSQQDIDITRKIKESCKLLDVQLLDHIILTPIETEEVASSLQEPGGYFSFADDGLI